MNESLSSSADRVQQALNEKGYELVVVELPASTRTAEEAARAVGCQVGQIAKSLIFEIDGRGRPALVIASGENRVDEEGMARYTGEPLRKASADFVREQTGFAIGGVPPIGHIQPIPTFIDEDLLQYDRIWAAAGTPRAVFRLTPQQLVSLTDGQVVAVK